MSSRVTTAITRRDRWPDPQVPVPGHEGLVGPVDDGSADGSAEHVRRELPHARADDLAGLQGLLADDLEEWSPAGGRPGAPGPLRDAG